MQPRLEVEDGYAPSSEDYKTSILLIELFHHIFLWHITPCARGTTFACCRAAVITNSAKGRCFAHSSKSIL